MRDLLNSEEISHEIAGLTKSWFRAENPDTKLREAERLIAKLDVVLAIIVAQKQGYEALRQEVTAIMKIQRECVLTEIGSREAELATFPPGFHVDSPQLYLAKKAIKWSIRSLQDDLASLDDMIHKLDNIG